MTNSPKVKIEFAPGCFDNFEGTQEELDELVAKIQEEFENPDILSKSIPLNIDDLDEEELIKLAQVMLSPEELEELKSLGMPNSTTPRNLQ